MSQSEVSREQHQIRLNVRETFPEKLKAMSDWLNRVNLKIWTSGTVVERLSFGRLKRQYLKVFMPTKPLEEARSLLTKGKRSEQKKRTKHELMNISISK